MTGSQSWQRAGAEEHAQGEREYNAAQAQGYAEGTKDRVGGRKDAVFGAITSDREQEARGKYVVDPSCCLMLLRVLVKADCALVR